jgi:hypothetical protein
MRKYPRTAGTVELGSIVVDPAVKVRKHGDESHLKRLRDALDMGAEFPPLLVETGTRILIGGVHRFYALKKWHGEGWESKTVRVEFVSIPKEGYPTEFRRLAVEDNKDHNALPLQESEVKAVIVELSRTLPVKEVQKWARSIGFHPARTERLLAQAGVIEFPPPSAAADERRAVTAKEDVTPRDFFRTRGRQVAHYARLLANELRQMWEKGISLEKFERDALAELEEVMGEVLG